MSVSYISYLFQLPFSLFKFEFIKNEMSDIFNYVAFYERENYSMITYGALYYLKHHLDVKSILYIYNDKLEKCTMFKFIISKCIWLLEILYV